MTHVEPNTGAQPDALLVRVVLSGGIVSELVFTEAEQGLNAVAQFEGDPARDSGTIEWHGFRLGPGGILLQKTLRVSAKNVVAVEWEQHPLHVFMMPATDPIPAASSLVSEEGAIA